MVDAGAGQVSWAGLATRWLEFFEGQELVAVVLVLFASGSDFSGQTGANVIDQGIKAIEDIDNALLFFNWRDRYFNFIQNGLG